MTEDIFKNTLGAKYDPKSTDYCLSNRRSSGSKQLEGWAVVGEITNHGEVMLLLARKKPEPPAPAAKPPNIAQRLVAAVKGK